MNDDIYRNGAYLERNPTWHEEHAPWKAKQIMRIIQRNQIQAHTICEIGCGTGEVLCQVQATMQEDCDFWGYDISPQAIELSRKKANGQLHFRLGDIAEDQDRHFDLILLIDVIEHVQDYRAFLGGLRLRSLYKILHIPLDLTVVNLLGRNRLAGLRTKVGHLHYFTKDIVLHELQAAQYEVLDWFYTPTFQAPAQGTKSRMIRPIRSLSFLASRGLTAKVWGGVGLMVLAK